MFGVRNMYEMRKPQKTLISKKSTHWDRKAEFQKYKKSGVKQESSFAFGQLNSWIRDY